MHRKVLQPALGFIAGVLIGLSIIAPVFGATSPGFERWNGLVTLLAIALLVGGFGLYTVRTGRERRLARIQPHERDSRP